MRWLSSIPKAFKLFFKYDMTQCAAASSFYIFITCIPITLLTINTIGILLGDYKNSYQLFFTFASKVFPSVAPETIEVIKKVVRGPLLNESGLTILNAILLLISSFSFFNSIWVGLVKISQPSKKGKLHRFLGGLFIFVVAAIVITTAVLLKFGSYMAQAVLDSTFFQDNVKRFLPIVYETLQSFVNVVNPESGIIKYLGSEAFVFVCLILFFSFAYRWFFVEKTSWADAIIGSITFVSMLTVSKELFWYYLHYLGNTLESNYGSYYSFIIGALWIYLLMCMFFYGACLCNTLKIRRIHDQAHP